MPLCKRVFQLAQLELDMPWRQEGGDWGAQGDHHRGSGVYARGGPERHHCSGLRACCGPGPVPRLAPVLCALKNLLIGELSEYLPPPAHEQFFFE